MNSETSPPEMSPVVQTPASEGAPPRESQAGVAAPQPAAGTAAASGDGADGSATQDRTVAPGTESEVGEAGGAAEGEGGTPTGEPSRRSRQRRRGRGKGGAEGEGAEAGVAQAEGTATPRPVAPAVEADPVALAERFGEVISGAYDAEPPEPDDEASLEQSTKRVLRPEPEAPKLHKLLAQSGIGSRRDMEQWIEDGKVTVNDEVAHIGMRVAQGDRIAVDGKPVRLRFLAGPPRVLAYHKPAGEVVTFNDPEGRPTVFRRLPRLLHGKWQSVGRLDINTEGLLLFTNAGELANQLMHPRFGVEREYAVRVLGSLDDAQRQRLLEGVEIEGQTASFKSIEDGGGEGANRWYRVVITEGRNREVRKLFAAVELAVSRLIRIRYGCVVLPRGLKRGVWVELDDADVRTIRQVVGRSKPQNERPADRQADRQADGNGARGGERAPQNNAKRGRGGKLNNGPRGSMDRPARQESVARAAPQADGGREPPARGRNPDGGQDDDFSRIPNPLEQTFDRRFAKGARRGPNHGFGSAAPREADFENGPPGSIPNPLEQTFDKRFVKGSQRINAGFGRPTEEPGPGGPQGGPRKGGPKQPDPMQTAVGYIGADAFFNRPGGKRGGGGGGGGGGRPGGGGGGGGNRGRR